MYCGLRTGLNKCLWLFVLLFAIGAVICAIVMGKWGNDCGDEINALPPDDECRRGARYEDEYSPSYDSNDEGNSETSIRFDSRDSICADKLPSCVKFLIGFYLFWPFVVLASIPCCVMCCCSRHPAPKHGAGYVSGGPTPAPAYHSATNLSAGAPAGNAAAGPGYNAGYGGYNQTTAQGVPVGYGGNAGYGGATGYDYNAAPPKPAAQPPAV